MHNFTLHFGVMTVGMMVMREDYYFCYSAWHVGHFVAIRSGLQPSMSFRVSVISRASLWAMIAPHRWCFLAVRPTIAQILNRRADFPVRRLAGFVAGRKTRPPVFDHHKIGIVFKRGWVAVPFSIFNGRTCVLRLP